MAWTPILKRPNGVASFPRVLAGPILRQVSPTSMSVWFALRTQGTITVRVYDDANSQIAASDPTQCAPVGTNLFFALVTVSIASPLTEGKIYLYDAMFTFTDGGSSLTANLATATGTADGQFAYSPYTRPSFCLPPSDVGKLRIIHGSCRKAHGEGPDALALLDSLITGKADHPNDRPHQLLLTGDQIYADDVADVLLVMVNDAGEALLGWPEMMHFPPEEGGAYASTALPPYARYMALTYLEFTSDDLKSHLMYLGEFFAMYLFAWSDAMWPKSSDDLPGYSDVETWVLDNVPASVREGWKEKIVEKQEDTINEEVGYIKRYKAAVPKVRKALANVPTYMICDDHEVTDDWNMTRRFCSFVYSKDGGRRVVQNALTAFAICQAWGNKPDRFASATPGAALLNHFNDICASGAPKAMSSAFDQHSPDIQRILGIHSDTTDLSAGRVFHDGVDALVNNSYTNPTSLRFDFHVEGPGHLVLVTDTRTWRAYPSKGKDSHADFLSSSFNPSELTHQMHLDKPLSNRLLIVVLTTNAPPIRSFRFAASHPSLVDTGQNVLEFIDTLSGLLGPIRRWSGAERAIYVNDLNDSWEFPSLEVDRLIVQLDNLLKTTGATHQAIILSGDVHSSFACRLNYWVEKQRLGDPTGTQTTSQMVIAQLVSSALKNEKNDTRGQQKSGYKYAPGWLSRKFVPKWEAEGYGGWNQVPYPDLATFQLDQKGPFGEVPIPKPDYRYRLDYLPTVETGQGAPPPPVLITGFDTDTWAKAYATAAAAQRNLYNSGGTLYQIIGHNNIAELTFAWQSNSKRAYHTLHWWKKEKGDENKDDPTDAYSHCWSRYDVSLNLDDPDYPPIKQKVEK
jgi:hypothetical protein